MSTETQHYTWHAEVNEEIARLVAWLEDNPHADARMARSPGHRGYLTVNRVTALGGIISTSVTLRDSRRAGSAQYRLINSLDDVFIKVGARYQPAREVVR